MKKLTLLLSILVLCANSTDAYKAPINVSLRPKTTKEAVFKKLRIVIRTLEVGTGLVFGITSALLLCHDIAKGNIHAEAHPTISVSVPDFKVHPHINFYSNLNKYFLGIVVSGFFVVDGIQHLEKEFRTP